MTIPKDFIEQVKNSSNIVQIAGRYIPLKQKGRQHWACCPFHHEKTPSFAISEQNQFYHCFGCNVSGNVFGLVQHLENVDFVAAVELLAKWANLKMPNIVYDPKHFEETRRRQRLLEIIEETKKCQKYNISLEFDIYVSHFLGDTIFSIDNCNSDYTNLPFYDGFFLYKNIPFYYIGIFLPDFFEKTGQMTFRRYGKTLDIKMKNVKYVYDNEIYEKELSWDYIFKDGKLILVGYSDCEWK